MNIVLDFGSLLFPIPLQCRALEETMYIVAINSQAVPRTLTDEFNVNPVRSQNVPRKVNWTS